jgi:hypothetical protein
MVTMAAPASKNRAADANEKVSLAANFLFADHSTAAKRSGAKRNKGKTGRVGTLGKHYLEEGRLFRLETNPTLRPCTTTRAEYFFF